MLVSLLRSYSRTHALTYSPTHLLTYARTHVPARSGGGLFSAATLTYRASNAFAPDVPLFVASGDGERNCTVETFAHSDPVSTLLAAYAISCRRARPLAPAVPTRVGAYLLPPCLRA